MRLVHYQQFLSHRFELAAKFPQEDPIMEGTLKDKRSGVAYPILKGIPRFVSPQEGSDSFGLQWNTFRSTQLDSRNGKTLSADRLWACSKWTPQELKGKTILEAGSGAGRFTEILLAAGAHVVSFDYSNAVDANFANNDSDRLFLFQGDIYNIPLEKNQFDYVFCYGVLQHTSDARKAFLALLEFLKPGGKFSMDHYEKIRKPSPWSTPKYFWRPITRKMEPKKLLEIVKFYIPLWLPFDTAIKRIPYFGRKIAALIPIPCWNYLDQGLSYKERKEWAIMDTFDALAPAYDTPRTKEEIAEWCRLPYLENVDVFLGGNGVVVNGRKK